MILSDLSGAIFALVGRHPDATDHEVVIATCTPGVPCRAPSGIASIHVGIDWQENLVILQPEIDLVVQPAALKRPLREVGMERLQQLREVYAKTGFDYGVKKSRESDWLDGFAEGARLR